MESWSKWLLAGGAFAAIGSMWSYIRGWAGYVTSYVIVTHTINWDIAWALAEYANTFYKKSKYGSRDYDSSRYPMRKTRQHATLVFERLGVRSLFWHGWKPLWVQTSSGGQQSSVPSVTYFRWTFDIDQVLEAAARHSNRLKQGDGDRERFAVHVMGGTWSLYKTELSTRNQERNSGNTRGNDDDGPNARYDLVGIRPLGWTLEDVGMDGNETARLDDLALSAEAQKLLKAIDVWFESRDWYRKRRVTWKLGARLFGEPGCGKTAFIRAVAYSKDLPIYLFDLATMTNDDLRDAWKIAMSNTPCITLFEDIDAVFHLDQPVNRDCPLTLDTLRQCLDGVQPHDGVLTFITTNKIELLDPSLKREGRTDFEVEFLPPDAAGLRKIAERICDEEEDLIEELLAKCQGKTGAAFQHICTLAASARMYEQHGLRVHREESDGELQTQQAPQADAAPDQQLRAGFQQEQGRGGEPLGER